MSLSLDRGTTPKGLKVKTFGDLLPKDMVMLGDYEISIEDYLIMSLHVLTNSDLVEECTH